MLPEQKLDALLARFAEVQSALAGQHQSDSYVKLSREFSELEPVVESINAYRAASRELAGIEALMADAATDPEMRAMAEGEKGALQERRDQLAQQVRLALVPEDAMDERNVILAIRAGTGGDEASLVA